MTTMKAGALTKALKQKYGTGRAGRATVLKKLGLLGLDEDLVLSAPPASNGNGDATKKIRVAIEQALADLDLRDLDEKSEQQIGRILEVLNKLDDDDPNAARAEQFAGDDEEKERRFCEFLRQHGLSDNEDIKRALDIVRGAADYSNGKPENVFKGGLRGGQIAGDADIARLVDRITIEPNFDDRRTRQVAVGMDSAAVDELNKMFPGIELIQTW
jgi:hypothetical protein